MCTSDFTGDLLGIKYMMSIVYMWMVLLPHPPFSSSSLHHPLTPPLCPSLCHDPTNRIPPPPPAFHQNDLSRIDSCGIFNFLHYFILFFFHEIKQGVGVGIVNFEYFMLLWWELMNGWFSHFMKESHSYHGYKY